ncbi:hypothetical protein CD30_14525 [Ureibacillus massiliensis 4400831 = CIP 108448 = CCUG 49529]|uniref:Arylmalonate decarboxylase n=1 Tax=Ureibacillus massiliensis 4400831 = CIP 108448 = CCUG 49529 TaxID=1211035 RepID=A0A0A3J3Z1_9BACL|nr:hypothetical protein CD30_14525 [Ureibacillus massiliensis 4400831 = CIP 108448 = CCUG 49529]
MSEPYFKPTFDCGAHPLARIGFICVANAGLTEHDMFLMKPNDVGVHFTRVRMQQQCTIMNLAEMESGLDDALVTLMPGRRDLDVICYNCTSGSFVIGEEKIIQKIESSRSKVKATTLLTGVLSAFRALNAMKVVIGTAYTNDINILEKEYFERNNIEVLNIKGLGLLTDEEMNKVTLDSLIKFAISIDHPDAEAIFLSCGALRSVEVIEKIESIVQKPVIASNQASLWHCLRLSGIPNQIEGFGRLMKYY